MSKRNVTKVIDEITEEFRSKLTKAVQQIWPKLVAAEVLRLTSVSTRPPSTARDQSEMLAKARKLIADEPGISQDEIGAKLGVSQGYISRLLKGVSP